MSINRNTANANTQSVISGLQTAADTKFIANVDSQITTAIGMGQYQVTAITSNQVNITTVYNYYANLGYAVTFPDFQQQNGQAIPSVLQQPQNFFGYNWVQYWLNAITQFHLQNPVRMTVSWI